MPRKATQKLFTWAALALSTTLLFGCATPRYDGKRAPDPTKAIIVGSITEGYLTQPHGLVVEIKKQGEPSTTLQLTTLGNEDDQPSRNLLGNLFMYEVPPGEYEVTRWNYEFYAGRSMARQAPVVFTVSAGETAYIGDMHADALRFCLGNVNNADKTLDALKRKYPVLNGRNILNLTEKTRFEPWPSSDATDSGKGLCKL